MGRRLNLGHLTEEECEQILKVIQKDFNIRQTEKDRLALIEAQVKEEDARLNILATREDFNDKYCMICFRKFWIFLVPRTQCSVCKYYYCKSCISFDVKLKTNICSSCHKHYEFLLQSNSWFYKRIGDKFKRFGSAKVIRSLYKRKTESDAESDSGYHPSIRGNGCLSESNERRSRPNLSKVFELDETYSSLKKSDEDEPLRTLGFYNQKLETVRQNLKKAFVESRGGQDGGQKSSYEDTLNKQAFNISLLLSSMTNDLTSNLNDENQNASKEIISKYVLEQCVDHIYESSLIGEDSIHPFGIDPEDLTLRSYIEKLSAAILSKINADLKASEDKIFQQEEEDVRKDLLRLSNRATITQMGKELSDSELEEFQITGDSISDIDGRDWQTMHSADSASASSLVKPEQPNSIDYDESEYDVDENSIFAFASRKKGTLLLPVLDIHKDPLRQSDVDLELTSREKSSSSEDPWTLTANGPATVMSNRIPIAPYDNYGERKCGPVETEGELKMFLPKRHSIEGPLIDNMNVYELSDLSDSSLGSPFEAVHDHLQSSNFSGKIQEDSDEPTVVRDFAEIPAVECGQPSIPRFVVAPQEVQVKLGEEFTCSCKLDGAKPLDVFWYQDDDQLVSIRSDDRHTLLNHGGMHKLIVDKSLASDAGLYHCIAINEHGTCQHSFTVTVLETNGFHEQPLDTNWKKEIGVSRLANTHQNKREHPEELSLAPAIDSKDEKVLASSVLEANTKKVPSHQELKEYYDAYSGVPEPNNSSDIFSDVLPSGAESQSEQYSLGISDSDHQNSNKDLDILFKMQENEKKLLIENEEEHEESLDDAIDAIVNKNLTKSNPDSTEFFPRKLHSLQNLEKSDVSETKAASNKPFTDNFPSKDVVISQNLSGRFSGVSADESKAPPNHKIYTPLETSSNSDMKTRSGRSDQKSGRSDLSEQTKHLESQTSNLIGTRHPKVIDDDLPKVDYRRYSRDYEVPKKDDNDQSSKTLADTSRSIRKSSFSSTSDSDVFEPDFATSNKASFNLTTQDTPKPSLKSDLDDIVLPSVKLLRMKFSAPRDTSAAESLLRKKNRPESKVLPDSQRKWKSVEHIDSPFLTPKFPVSVVSLQPAPINSRSTSRTSTSDDGFSFHGRPETKFQKEVIIRQQTVNKSQSDEESEQSEQLEPPPQASSVAGRLLVRPFSQRSDSLNSDKTKTNTRATDYPR